jgi:glycosyltransferase involved in cell wall biosynthesis
MPESKRRPRVAFLTDVMTPYMVAALAELAKRVELEALFCSERGSRGLDWQFGNGIGFRHRVINGLTRAREDEVDIYLSPRILAALVRARPDAVISGSFGVPTLYGLAYCRLRGVPLLVHSDGTSDSERRLGRAQRATRALLARSASAAVANSEPAAERFEEVGFPAGRVFRALHSTNLTELGAIADQRSYGGPGRLALLATGRLIPRKGLDHLFRALALAQQRAPGISLTLAGSGPEEQGLRALAGKLGLEGVTFQGFVEQAALPAVYAAADAYVFPTLRDPFGIALLEAAAAGLPIVTSPRAGAAQDLLRDGESALFCEPQAVEQLAGALVQLAEDVALRERLGRAAHLAAAGRSPARTAAGYAEAVEATLGG